MVIIHLNIYIKHIELLNIIMRCIYTFRNRFITQKHLYTLCLLYSAKRTNSYIQQKNDDTIIFNFNNTLLFFYLHLFSTWVAGCSNTYWFTEIVSRSVSGELRSGKKGGLLLFVVLNVSKLWWLKYYLFYY